MAQPTYFISELKVVKKEQQESKSLRSNVEDVLNDMNIGAQQEIIVSGNPMNGEYRVVTYQKLNDLCVKIVASEIRG